MSDVEPVRASASPKPDLSGTVIVRDLFEDLGEVLLTDMLLQAQNCVRAFGDFHLAISASEQTEPALVRLMLDPAYRLLPWKRTHLWTIDDCLVAIDDDRSRGKRLREILVDHSDIPIDQVHGIPVSDDDPAIAYQDEIRETLGWREKGQDRLDFALLSLGDGGPISEALAGRHHADDGPDLVIRKPWKDPRGIQWHAMSPRMISASRLLAVLAVGEPARADVSAIAEARRIGGPNTAIGGIKPIGGEMRWYLDAAANPSGSNP
ncbi:MAG: 6-phosphogluconolactonase [Phycisphaerales bacterium]|nr:6-phosphogluconolactonase [Phycisphaerales bacterium]